MYRFIALTLSILAIAEISASSVRFDKHNPVTRLANEAEISLSSVRFDKHNPVTRLASQDELSLASNQPPMKVKPGRKPASQAEFSLASLVSLSPLSLLAESDPNQATPSDLAPVDGDTSSGTTD
jgi:hypothetical protein